MNSRHRGGVNLSPRWHEDVTAVTEKRHRGDSCFLILRFKVDSILDCGLSSYFTCRFTCIVARYSLPSVWV